MLVNPVTVTGTLIVPGKAPETVAQVVTGAFWANETRLVRPRIQMAILNMFR
jgi:hypothetical protein